MAVDRLGRLFFFQAEDGIRDKLGLEFRRVLFRSGLIVVAFFVAYQQVENHVLQPVIYGRTVQLSPLAVLIAVLIGAELAGVLGALAAIPIAGKIGRASCRERGLLSVALGAVAEGV